MEATGVSVTESSKVIDSFESQSELSTSEVVSEMLLKLPNTSGSGLVSNEGSETFSFAISELC